MSSEEFHNPNKPKNVDPSDKEQVGTPEDPTDYADKFLEVQKLYVQRKKNSQR